MCYNCRLPHLHMSASYVCVIGNRSDGLQASTVLIIISCNCTLALFLWNAMSLQQQKICHMDSLSGASQVRLMSLHMVLGPPNICALLRQEVRHADGKTERAYGDGRREVAFANGTLRMQLPDGRAVVRFTNGDVKKAFPCGVPPPRFT